VAWILFCKICKFGEKIFYNSRDIEFFLRDYFFLARPVHRTFNTNPKITLLINKIALYWPCRNYFCFFPVMKSVFDLLIILARSANCKMFWLMRQKECLMWPGSSDHRPVDEETDAVTTPQQSVIPCEFCLELFDEHMITEHQVSLAMNVEFLCMYFQTVAIAALSPLQSLYVCGTERRRFAWIPNEVVVSEWVGFNGTSTQFRT